MNRTTRGNPSRWDNRPSYARTQVAGHQFQHVIPLNLLSGSRPHSLLTNYTPSSGQFGVRDFHVNSISMPHSGRHDAYDNFIRGRLDLAFGRVGRSLRGRHDRGAITLRRTVEAPFRRRRTTFWWPSSGRTPGALGGPGGTALRAPRS